MMENVIKLNEIVKKINNQYGCTIIGHIKTINSPMER